MAIRRQSGNASQISAAGTVRARNQARILDAAEAVFAAHGYRGGSLSAIAQTAGLARANLLYYFKSKHGLYVALLERTMTRWNDLLEKIDVDDEPAQVLSAFIRAKLSLVRQYPQASRLFAGEVLQGAPMLQDYLRGPLREWVDARAAILSGWIERGQLDARIDPHALIFLIWSTTQHYADYEAQVLALTGRESLTDADEQRIGDFLCHMVLAGCGLTDPGSPGSGA
ncbi:transcriptional regulator, TetR family [Kushneria avicenniae]|uniref:Transcriptional regulator, TetR family n=1 Tax=Kushneria avicenniae TaxID=402385 RepID=A0A1I1M256_9GAMM|nr:TetR family transcriptional regulator C-terminal domain-containing protein [Kushneria avicenniae]SFC75740.1 transcriptional regulator, TetR family [Kushneria avicenniae]